MIPSTFIFAGALLLSGAAAVTDARTGHIPNWITVPPLLVAPVLHGLWGGLFPLGMSLAAILVCGLVPYLMFRRGACGGGDVKLFAALGALGGPGFGLEAQLFGFTVAIFCALVLLTWHGKLFTTLKNTAFLGLNPVLPRRYRRKLAPESMATIRLGIPIFCGVLAAVWVRRTLLGV